MECGMTYIQTVFPKGHRFEWIRWCAMTPILPKELQDKIKDLSSYINTEFKDDIIIPMDNKIIPGCVMKTEATEKIVNSMYNGFVDMFEELVPGTGNYIRCVYSTGEIPDELLENCESTHEIGNCQLTIRVGRYLESEIKPGLFRV